MSLPIITAQELVDITQGAWTQELTQPVHYIRESLAHIEEGLTNFLYAPEFFYSTATHSRDQALLTSLDAVEKGAIGCIVTQRPRNLAPTVPCLIVADVQKAILTLAQYQRDRAKAKFIFVCGSVGKSTTKNLTASLCKAVGTVTKSVFNYNTGNSIELMLANVAEDTQYMVQEVAIRNIDKQASLIKPDVVILTMVEKEHVSDQERAGFFGDDAINQIIEKKCRPFAHLSYDGTAVLNIDNQYYDRILAKAKAHNAPNILTFGVHKDADIRLTKYQLYANHSEVTIDIKGVFYNYTLSLAGMHLVHNSLSSIAALYAVGGDIAAAIEAFSHVVAEDKKGNFTDILWKGGSVTLINDTTNSTLPALRALFKTLSLQPISLGGKRIAVLGSVPDLGSIMQEEMELLAGDALGSSIDKFYTIGEEMLHFNNNFTDRSRIADHVQSLEELELVLQEELCAGDIVALKSSRRPEHIALRRIWDRLTTKDANKKKSIVQGDFAKDKESHINVLIGGDTYLGENYQDLRESKGKTHYLKRYGYDHSFLNLAPLMQDSDCVVLNLESALTSMDKSPLDNEKGFVLNGNPEATIAALNRHNVKAVMLGNNHAMDYGEQGLLDTISALKQGGITPFGAGSDLSSGQAALALHFKRKGQEFKLAIISAYHYNMNYDKVYKFYSGNTKPGVNNLKISRLQEQIARLKDEGYYVIMSPHWGKNYALRQFQQTSQADTILRRCRADLILGHGPHVFNEFQMRQNAWVIFSLGNFIFNSEGEYEKHQLPPYSFVASLNVAFGKYGHRKYLDLYPIVSCNRLTQFQPSFVSEQQFEQITAWHRLMQYDASFFDNNIIPTQTGGRYHFRLSLL